jgi:hypothetical protein
MLRGKQAVFSVRNRLWQASNSAHNRYKASHNAKHLQRLNPFHAVRMCGRNHSVVLTAVQRCRRLRPDPLLRSEAVDHVVAVDRVQMKGADNV